MAELGEFTITNENKVHVDIDMLDYDYINKCNDSQKLRAIVEVLKSGKEGYYPDVSYFSSLFFSFVIFLFFCYF